MEMRGLAPVAFQPTLSTGQASWGLGVTFMTLSISFPHSRSPVEAVLVIHGLGGRSMIRPLDPEVSVPIPAEVAVLAVSPDHSHLLWTECTDATARWYHGDLKPPVERIQVAPVGGEPRVLMEGIRWSVAWSADSRSVWAVMSRRDRDVRSVVRTPLDGSAEVPYGRASDALPSPAGVLVLLHHASPARSVLVAVDRPDDVRWEAALDPIGWSPDGTSFAYRTPAAAPEPRELLTDPAPAGELWTVATDGFVAKRVAASAGRAVWLSDGTLMYTRRQAMAAFPGMFTEGWFRYDPETGVETALKGAAVDPLAHPRYPIIATTEFGHAVVWNLETGDRTTLGSGAPQYWIDW